MRIVVTLSAPLTWTLAMAALLAGEVAGQTQGPEGGQGDEMDGRRTMVAARLSPNERIRLDGTVDEAVWRRATPATDFLQKEPDEGAAPSERTEVFVAFDADNLYIGAVLYDSNPDGILAYQKQRDAGLGTDDRFMWILDTFLDGRTGYFFEINPAGLMGDGLIGGGGGGGFGGGGPGGGGFGVNKSWDGIWEARVTQHGEGWSAEVRIPFSTLNFDPSGRAWGINFQRTVRRRNEEIVWSGYRRNQQLTRPVHGGVVTGLEGMSQGFGLEVKPYGVASWRNTPADADPTEYPADAGFDVSYNVTPSLRASVTVNTDFAEVEVDQRRVNLTRFPLFFPERRDFFLEGSGVFSFAERNGVTPYFSRNIGLAEGEPVPISYGARLGGQAGRYEVGFIQVRTGGQERLDGDGLPLSIAAEDFTVARVKRTLFRQSSLGVIYTRRASDAADGAPAPSGRHTVGVDLDLFTSRFLGDKNLQFEAFAVWNSDASETGDVPAGDRTARGVRLNYPNDTWRIHTSYRELPESFDPALGFTRRNGFRRFQPTVTFAPRPAGIAAIRQLEFEVQYEHLMDFGWDLATRKTDVTPLNIRFESGDQLNFMVTQLYERIAPGDEFDVGGLTIRAGEYNTLRWQGSVRTAGRRRVSGRVEVSGGEFWSGTRSEQQLGVDVRPRPGVTLGVDYEHNDVRLPEGEFSTNLLRVTGGWHISPWASFNGNVQYDDVSGIVGLFGRLRWIVKPGSDLYVVYTHNWQNPVGDARGGPLYTISRGAATKFSYTYRF